MNLTFEIDFADLMKSLKSGRLVSEILAELNPDEADILDYMSITRLVQLAFDKNPQIVRNNLIQIIGPRKVPDGLLQLSTFLRIAYNESDTHEFMETIKSALRNEVTILYEVK